MRTVIAVCLTLCLSAALALPASALNYTIDAPGDPDYRQELTPQQEVLLRRLMANLEGEDLTVMESILTKFARRTG